MADSAYVGRYVNPGTPGFEIVEREGGLFFHLPGAPPWADTPLRPVGDGDDLLEYAAGPYAGALLSFDRDDDGALAGANVAGILRFARTNADVAPYVCRQVSAVAGPVAAEFRSFFERAVVGAAGAEVAYELAHPLDAFLQWLVDARGLLLHGSNDGGIARFEPRRRTLGPARDQSDRGISACGDSLWAMAYAILDRARYAGSFHNTAMPFEGPEGAVRLYNFSIGESFRTAAAAPFTDGTVYALPAGTFRRARVASFSPIGLEFTSAEPVEPLARFRVRQADFPLLDQVRGHDDRAVMRFIELRKRLLRECDRADPLEDGYALHFDDRPGLSEDLTAWCAMLARGYPWIGCDLQPARQQRVTLTLTGSTGLRDILDAQLEKARSVG